MSKNLLFPSEAGVPTYPRRPTVGQLMRPPTKTTMMTMTIEPEAHVAAATYLMKHFHDSALVVVTEDTHEPVAMITDAEIVQAVADGRDLEATRITQVATAKPLSVQANVAAEDAVRLMLAEGVPYLPVVEGRRLVGMVELTDLCQMSLPPGPLAADAGTALPGRDGEA
ncbi:MAG: CBS domain-containing protein [Frankia sp.]